MELLAGILGVIEEDLAGGELVSVHVFVPSHLLNEFISAEQVHEAEGTWRTRYTVCVFYICVYILQTALLQS